MRFPAKEERYYCKKTGSWEKTQLTQENNRKNEQLRKNEKDKNFTYCMYEQFLRNYEE